VGERDEDGALQQDARDRSREREREREGESGMRVMTGEGGRERGGGRNEMEKDI